MPNGIDINSITPSFRDFLLSRNLLLADSIENSGYASIATGLGLPTDIGDMSGVIDARSIEDIALEERTIDITQNMYTSDNPNYQVSIDTNPISNQVNTEYSQNISSEVIQNQLSIISQETLNTLQGRNYYIGGTPQMVTMDYSLPSFTEQVNTYQDVAGGLGSDGFSSQPLDVISTLTSGESPLISPNGSLVSTQDVRTSLVGRVLGATGVVEDTPLGVIAGEQLGRQIINNLGRNAVQETVGRVNTSIVDILRGGDIIVPNYQITNNVENTIADFTGFNLGRGLPDDLFFGGKAIGNINRANEILTYTGKAHTDMLLSNLRLNRFRAGLTGMEPGPFGYVYMVDGDVSKTVLESNFLPKAFGDERDLSVSTPINDEYLKTELFEDVQTLKTLTNDTFSWDGDTDGIEDTTFIGRLNTSPDSILDKTKRLFDSGFIRTLDSREFAIDSKSEVQTGIKNGKISKGSAVVGADGNFCRVWTKKNTYSRVENLQKNEGMRLGTTTQQKASVLDDNGFVRMSPIAGDNSFIKRYMFSIENLAWEGSTLFDKLLPCEIGNNGGRVMWFPPYDLQFTDNTSAKWDSHEFIGRPEPMYTYNNSERTGNISFKIIVDNPSAINAIRENAFNEGLNDIVDAYFAGCQYELPDEVISVLSASEQEALKVATAQVPTTKAANPVQPFEPFSVYFLNDVHVYESTYENGSGTPYNGGANYIPSVLNGGDGSSNSDNDDNAGSRNKKFNDLLAGTELSEYFSKNGESVKVEIFGYASSQGTSDRNQVLSDKRADAIEKELRLKYGNDFKVVKVEGRSSQGSGSPEQNGVSYTTNMKDARRVDVKISVDPTLNTNVNKADTPATKNTQAVQQAKNKVKKRMFTECHYFSKLEQTDEFVGAVDKIYEKIKYFTPAFHSVTPEGFNSRLTFLLQCTKPGETAVNKNDDGPDNLSFGRPPVCVLRIGDFYHTKIIIDSVNFSFDPLLWDLNPEGIGVQPMLVNVDLGVKFIGGSSLEGPIKQLQNALGFNFFANTEVYNSNSIKGGAEFQSLGEVAQSEIENTNDDERKEIIKDRLVELQEETLANDETKNDSGTISPDEINIIAIKQEAAIDTNDIEVGMELVTTFNVRGNKEFVFSTNTESISYKLQVPGSTPKLYDLGVVEFNSDSSKQQQKTFYLPYTTVSKEDILSGYIIGGTVRKKI